MNQEQTIIRLEVRVVPEWVERTVAQAFIMGASGVELRDHETGHEAELVSVLSWHSGEPEALVTQVREALGDDHQVIVSREGTDGWTVQSDQIRYASEQLLITEGTEAEPGPTAHINLVSDVGFGGGSHETTRLALQSLEAQARDAKLGRVMDYGTGTGILALAAAALGAQSVVGVDIDHVALDTARLNVNANDFHDTISIGDPSPDFGSFDVVVANLYLGALVNELDGLARMMAPGAVCLITGFTSAHKSTIEGVATECGLRVVNQRACEPWLLLEMVRLDHESERKA